MISQRPYHHGDLRRALIAAARRLLEAEGPEALSLRATAREAGVSPAAPYHHFKDKDGLLAAVAEEGYAELADDLRRVADLAPDGKGQMTATSVAYAGFAIRRRRLYRVMAQMARRGEYGAEGTAQAAVAMLMHKAAAQSCGPDASPRDVQLALLAAWGAAHGLADLAAFRQVEPLKAELGGDEAFLEAVIDHLGDFAPRPAT
jgi:AcrR family transcriptional regulator